MSITKSVFAVSVSLVAYAAASADSPRNVIIVGWDGCQRNHLKEMIKRKEVPNLVALSKEGKMVDITVTTGATDTKAGWSQILTGYKPTTTGVYSNGRYQPIPKGLTIFERVEKALGPEKVYTAMIVAKKGHVDNDGPRKVLYTRWAKQPVNGKAPAPRPRMRLKRLGLQTVTENGREFVVIPGKPWFTAQNGMDSFKNGLLENEKVAANAMKTIEDHKDGRFLLFVHFARPDHDGHKHGENSNEYTEGIKQDDAWTGKIIQKLKDLELYKDTLVYIVADHGFDEGLKSHKNAPYVFLATNDKAVKRDGDRADIAPTILKRFGIEPGKTEPKVDGKPLG